MRYRSLVLPTRVRRYATAVVEPTTDDAVHLIDRQPSRWIAEQHIRPHEQHDPIVAVAAAGARECFAVVVVARAGAVDIVLAQSTTSHPQRPASTRIHGEKVSIQLLLVLG